MVNAVPYDIDPVNENVSQQSRNVSIPVDFSMSADFSSSI